MPSPGKKTKFFRVATEGATTDGRQILRADIEQMAANYDPKKYAARVNLEHIRGLFPDGPFKMYGDVLALKAEEVENGKLALFAQISPTDELVNMVNVNRQKVFTSVEIRPNFAGTGQSYLMGLAVTDNPASLGCEMLQFSAQAQTSPLAKRKQQPDDLFTEAIEAEVVLEGEDTGHAATLTQLLSQLKSLFTPTYPPTIQRHPQETTPPPSTFSQDTQHLHSIALAIEALNQQQQQLSAENQALKADLAKITTALTQQPTTLPRVPTPGGNQKFTLTDC